MLGYFEDRAYVLYAKVRDRGTDQYPKDDLIWEPPKDGSSEAGIWFLPAHVYDNDSRRDAVAGNAYVFRVHPGAITPDPVEIRQYLEGLSEAAGSVIVDARRHERITSEASIGGSSLGGIPATLAAQRFDLRALYLRATGADFPVSIRESAKTGPVFAEAVRNGFSADDFNRELSHLSPVNNLDGLPRDVRVLLGRHDVIIPFYQGRLLCDAMRERGMGPKVQVMKFLGHRTSFAKTKLFG